MIPLENIISASRGTGTRIAAAVSSSDDITEQDSLEHGRRCAYTTKIDLLNYSLAINQVASKERTPDQVHRSWYSEVTEIAAVGMAIGFVSTSLIPLNWGRLW